MGNASSVWYMSLGMLMVFIALQTWGILLMLLYSIGHSALVMTAGTSVGFVQRINGSTRYAKASSILKILMGTAILLIGLYMFYPGF